MDVELLKTLKKIAQSASSSADLVDCIKWLAKLKDEKKNDTIEEISKQVELLVRLVLFM